MSGGNTTVSLTLLIKGDADIKLRKMNEEQIRSTSKINQNWIQIGSAQAKFVNLTKQGTQNTLNTARAGDQLLKTNRMLEGVLRQQSIQTRLQSQLLKQQVTSSQQLANYQKQIEQSSRRTRLENQQTISLWQKGVALGGAGMASGMVVHNALQKPRDYDQLLTYITGTATAGKGLTTGQRLAEKSTLNNMVKDAVRQGGGTRESAAEALNTLMASGEYELNNVKPALNAAVKTAFATDADANDAATLTVRMKDFGIQDLNYGHDMAMRGGQLGSFEYKDQAKWLSQQMGAARVAGYSGDKGFAELVAMNQIAKTTAATSDEAGNNIVNLLQKLSSSEFSDSIGEAVALQSGDPTRIKGKKKKSVVFDWSTYSMQQREQGVYGVDAFVKVLERQLAGNKKYQSLKNQANLARTPEAKKQTLEDMANIAVGSEIGKIIADRQALMAALSVVYNQDKKNQIVAELQKSSGTVESESKFVQSNEWAKDIAMNQEKLFAQSKAYDAVSESLGNFKDGIKDIAQKHEGVAAAAYTASIALMALAAGAGAATILGGGKGGLLGRAGGLAGAGGMAARTGGYGLAIAGAGAAGYGIGTGIRNLYMKTETGQKFDEWGGEKIAQLLAAFGNDEAQAALDAQAKYDQMIKEQQEANTHSRQTNRNLSELIQSVKSGNKMIPDMSNLFAGQSPQQLVGDREGAVPYYLQKR